MSYDIEYTDSKTGEKAVHQFSGSEANAEGWLKTLQAENGGKATLYNNRPYGGGPRKEVASKGDAGDKSTRSRWP